MNMKFTLRDLFWLVLVAGMGLGWWVERRQLIKKQEGLQEAMQSAEFRAEIRWIQLIRQFDLNKKDKALLSDGIAKRLAEPPH